MKEEAVLFGTGTDLVGIVTEPDERDASAPATVFLNAGVTHRIGPSRLHVRMARELAARGRVSIRFDFSGLGDSSRRSDDLPVAESVVKETREAMDLLAKTRGIERFVLVGICSGATISYITSKQDDRVVGVALVNAQSHLHGMDPDLGDHLRERTVAAHSWRIALKSSFRSKNWRKALGGQLNPLRIARMMVGIPMAMLFKGKEQGAAAKAYDAAADLRAVTDRGVKLLHLYSEGDEGLDYFNVVLTPAERAECDRGDSRLLIMEGANHVFTLLWSQDELVDAVVRWMEEETS